VEEGWWFFLPYHRRGHFQFGRFTPLKYFASGLKLPARVSDFLRMARDLSCPVCNADLLLSGDEQLGEEVYCTYCGAPCRIKQGTSPDAVDVEEDF